VASGARSAACGAVGGNRAISDAGRTDAGRFPDKFCGERRPEVQAVDVPATLPRCWEGYSNIRLRFRENGNAIGTSRWWALNRCRTGFGRHVLEKNRGRYRLTAHSAVLALISTKHSGNGKQAVEISQFSVSRHVRGDEGRVGMARKHPVPLAQQLVFTVVRSVEAPVGWAASSS